MYLEETQFRAAKNITVSRAPERVWQRFFISGEPRAEIPRSSLVRRLVRSDARWIAIDGAPGMGRTTLLGQIADELLGSGEWFHAIWTERQVHEIHRDWIERRSGKLEPMLRWLKLQAKSSASGRLTLLIDDFDLCAVSDYGSALEEIIAALPALRLITISIEPLLPSAELSQGGVTQIQRISEGDLVFSAEETEQLATAVIGQRRGADPLALPKLTRRLHLATGGIPLAVSLALDRMGEDTELPSHELSQVMNVLYTDMLRTYMRSMNPHGISAMYRTFSLMPRFSYLHISVCFPDVSFDTIATIAASPALDMRRRVRAGEYAWSEDFLLAARELNTARVAERRELATKLYRSNYPGAAFEQWYLAGDLARAEAMLRTRFLTVFETLSPETAAEVHALAPSSLAPYPMIRVLQTLLDPHATVLELRQCAENLRILGGRGGAAGLVALAVRAAVLARKGLAKQAHDQAEAVLQSAERQLFEDFDETEAELRSVAEAMLTATLALFEIGAIPSELSVLPRGHGSQFLRIRRDLAQGFLDAVRAEPAAKHAFSNRLVPYTYRALIFSDVECSRGIEALAKHDQRFLDALRAADGTRSSDTAEARSLETCLACFTVTRECLRLMSLGDHQGAFELAHSTEVFEPQSSLLQAIVLLETGRARDAKNKLDAMRHERDPRSEATRAVLRASALLKLGFPEPARAELIRSSSLQPSLIVQGLGFMRPEDACALAQLYPPYADFANVAASIGVLGTGWKLKSERRFQTLTEKERTVLLGLRDGLNTREIADRHYLSVNTVRTHVRSIGKKLDASGQEEMLRRAAELRILPAS